MAVAVRLAGMVEGLAAGTPPRSIHPPTCMAFCAYMRARARGSGVLAAPPRASPSPTTYGA
eukprot:4947146-Alexandrium_andersonii.AAC.1